MRVFVCPKCNERVEALASEVGHNCPSNRRAWTNFVQKRDLAENRDLAAT